MYRVPMFFYNLLGTLWGFAPQGIYDSATKRKSEGNNRLMAILDWVDNVIISGCEKWTPEGHPWNEGPIFQRPSYYLGKLGL